jgi:hypothetical protein
LVSITRIDCSARRDLLRKLRRDRRGRRHRLLALGQRRIRRALVVAGALPRRKRVLDRLRDRCAIRGERRFLAPERADLLGQLRDLLGDPGFALARESELLLEARHLGIGFVERALPLVQRIARGVMIGAQRFELRLGGPHLGLDALERHREVRHRRRVPLARVRRVLLLREPQQVLDELEARLVLAELGRDLRLRVELLELRAELDANVLDPGEILVRLGEPCLGFLAPLLVLGDAGRLLEEHAQLLGLRLDHARDHPLLDDRVRARAEARAEEEVVDVPAADRNVVDVVRRILVARQHPLDGELGVLAPLPADATRGVVEVELDRRAADGLPLAGAVEDHVLHRFAAQRGRLRFAEHPAARRRSRSTCRSRWARRCRRAGRAWRWASGRRTT